MAPLIIIVIQKLFLDYNINIARVNNLTIIVDAPVLVPTRGLRKHSVWWSRNMLPLPHKEYQTSHFLRYSVTGRCEPISDIWNIH